MKKKILLVETASHFSVFKHLHFMLSKCYDVRGYFPFKHYKHIQDFAGATHYFKYNQRLIYFFLIFKSINYDYVYLSTGPQYVNRRNGFFILLGYIIYVLIHGDKTILQIRDNKYYYAVFSNNILDRFNQRVRHWSINKMRLVTFESQTLRNTFFANAPHLSINDSISYVYYSDVEQELRSSACLKCTERTIGLLGSFDRNRRNYSLLIDALDILSPALRSNITLINLGFAKFDSSVQIIEEISRYVRFYILDGYLSDDYLYEKASKCSYFLSPLNSDQGYGVNKGTGAIGDAIRFKKMLLIPSFVDPYKEFNDFCFYYNSAHSLAKIIENSFSIDFSKNHSCFAKYNSLEVSQRIEAKLAANFV